MQTCHSKLNNKNVVVLVDGTVEIPDLGLPQITVPQGDSKSRTIASAKYRRQAGKGFPHDFHGR